MQVDNDVKTFNIGDQFVVHTFKGHLIAAVHSILKVKFPNDPVAHASSLVWLEKTSPLIVTEALLPHPQPAQGFPTHSISLH